MIGFAEFLISAYTVVTHGRHADECSRLRVQTSDQCNECLRHGQATLHKLLATPGRPSLCENRFASEIHDEVDTSQLGDLTRRADNRCVRPEQITCSPGVSSQNPEFIACFQNVFAESITNESRGARQQEASRFIALSDSNGIALPARWSCESTRA